MVQFINIAHYPLARLDFSTLINPPDQSHLPYASHNLTDNRELIEPNKQYMSRFFILHNHQYAYRYPGKDLRMA